MRIDNGGDFTSQEFQEFFKLNGIQHQTSTPYTPQQNGVVKLLNHIIVKITRYMFHHRNLEPSWVEVLMTTMYLKVRSSNKKTKKQHLNNFGMGESLQWSIYEFLIVMPTFTNLVRPKQNWIQRTKDAYLWAKTRIPKRIN